MQHLLANETGCVRLCVGERLSANVRGLETYCQERPSGIGQPGGVGQPRGPLPPVEVVRREVVMGPPSVTTSFRKSTFREVIGPVAWGTGATLVLAILIVVGSRNLAHFDAALVGYTFSVLFATFGLTYRYAMWLQRPPRQCTGGAAGRRSSAEAGVAATPAHGSNASASMSSATASFSREIACAVSHICSSCGDA